MAPASGGAAAGAEQKGIRILLRRPESQLTAAQQLRLHASARRELEAQHHDAQTVVPGQILGKRVKVDLHAGVGVVPIRHDAAPGRPQSLIPRGQSLHICRDDGIPVRHLAPVGENHIRHQLIAARIVYDGAVQRRIRRGNRRGSRGGLRFRLLRSSACRHGRLHDFRLRLLGDCRRRRTSAFFPLLQTQYDHKSEKSQEAEDQQCRRKSAPAFTTFIPHRQPSRSLIR